MTQSGFMRRFGAVLGGLLILGTLCGMAQTGDDPVTVSSDHPRLLLRPNRLRLLRRERERTSARWQQFEALVAGNAPLAEPGFALALYYQVSGDAEAGKRAIAWALGTGNDLRQAALVFDWCQDLLSDAQKSDLAGRLAKGLAQPPTAAVGDARSRAMAAIALFDHVPQTPQRELERIVHKWWEGSVVPAIQKGSSPVSRDDAYALYELLHVLRDNTTIDLRESTPRFFKDYPIEHLLSYYPAAYPGPDTEYYIGAEAKTGEPDLRLASLSRAAELAMVAYDANAAETQVLQGWLMHDRFILRSTLGAPYEFLWANPYQPGLSYYHVPLVYYNPDLGKLFVRSSWEDSAKWLGYFDGVVQVFDEGRAANINPKTNGDPIDLTEAVICLGHTARKFQVKLDEQEGVFVVGLEPNRKYLVEIDDEELYEMATDPGGILPLEVPRGHEVGIRIR